MAFAPKPAQIVRSLAENQQGVVSRAEALAAGMDRSAIYRLTSSGEWSFILPGVIRVTRGQSDWHQMLMAACKWGKDETAASHRAAAALLHLEGFPPEVVEISTKGGKDPRQMAFHVHRSTVFDRTEITTISNIPTTTATRTLLDLGAVVESDKLELALEDALRRGLTSVARLKWFLDVHAQHGRRGIGLMRRLLAEKERRASITESGFEMRLFQELRRARLPLPVPQYSVTEAGRTIARVDFAYPQQRLALEAVSYKWHSARGAWKRDQTRWNELVARGWRIVNVTWDELRDRPHVVIALIRDALGGQAILFG
jgi:very-short-patch-repair endonuclease